MPDNETRYWQGDPSELDKAFPGVRTLAPLVFLTKEDKRPGSSTSQRIAYWYCPDERVVYRYSGRPFLGGGRWSRMDTQAPDCLNYFHEETESAYILTDKTTQLNLTSAIAYRLAGKDWSRNKPATNYPAYSPGSLHDLSPENFRIGDPKEYDERICRFQAKVYVAHKRKVEQICQTLGVSYFDYLKVSGSIRDKTEISPGVLDDWSSIGKVAAYLPTAPKIDISAEVIRLYNEAFPDEQVKVCER